MSCCVTLMCSLLRAVHAQARTPGQTDWTSTFASGSMRWVSRRSSTKPYTWRFSSVPPYLPPSARHHPPAYFSHEGSASFKSKAMSWRDVTDARQPINFDFCDSLQPFCTRTPKGSGCCSCSRSQSPEARRRHLHLGTIGAGNASLELHLKKNKGVNMTSCSPPTPTKGTYHFTPPPLLFSHRFRFLLVVPCSRERFCRRLAAIQDASVIVPTLPSQASLCSLTTIAGRRGRSRASRATTRVAPPAAGESPTL